MNKLIESVMPMFVDIYRQTDSQDPNTGAIKKEWNYIQTLSCHAKSMISNSTARGADKQQLAAKYRDEQFLEVRTLTKISLRDKLTNIRDQSNKTIWTELDYPSETPTVFEVVGVSPITDPFGDILAYNTLVKRSEVQAIGI